MSDDATHVPVLHDAKELARETLYNSIDTETTFDDAYWAAFIVIADAVPSEIESVADNLMDRFVIQQFAALFCGGAHTDAVPADVNERLAQRRLVKVPAA